MEQLQGSGGMQDFISISKEGLKYREGCIKMLYGVVQ